MLYFSFRESSRHKHKCPSVITYLASNSNISGEDKAHGRPRLEPRTSRISCEHSDHWATEPHGRPVTDGIKYNTTLAKSQPFPSGRSPGYLKQSDQKGKQKSPGRATSRSRSQSLTQGIREKVTQINVCIASKQMHDKHKDQLPIPQARSSKC